MNICTYLTFCIGTCLVAWFGSLSTIITKKQANSLMIFRKTIGQNDKRNYKINNYQNQLHDQLVMIYLLCHHHQLVMKKELGHKLNLIRRPRLVHQQTCPTPLMLESGEQSQITVHPGAASDGCFNQNSRWKMPQ